MNWVVSVDVDVDDFENEKKKKEVILKGFLNAC